MARPKQIKYYNALNDALQSLYANDRLNLKNDGKKKVSVKESTFIKAIKAIFKKNGYDPKMLSDPAVKALIDETYRVFKQAVSTGIADNVIPPAMALHLDHSAFIFSGFKIHNELSEVGLSLRDDNGVIKSFDRFKYDVQKIHENYNVNYLQAEYQFAIHSSQSAAHWAKITQDANAYDLQYRTAGDEDVRASHRPLDGITLPADDPFWTKYYPPNGWRCRCIVNQVRKGKYPLSDSTQAMALGEKATTQIGKNSENKAAIFRFNPGMVDRIFPAKHPYLPKGCEGCGKQVNLAYDASRPECVACAKIREMVKQQEKEARKDTFQKMKRLYGLSVKKNVVISGEKKEITVHFDKDGNKHLYHDLYTKCDGKLTRAELINFDKIVEKAKFDFGPVELYKVRKDNIKDFMYFDVKVNGVVMQVQIGRRDWIKNDGEHMQKYIAYCIKKR